VPIIEIDDSKTDLAEKNDDDDSAKKATIKIKAFESDKEEIIKKLKEVLERYEVEIK